MALEPCLWKDGVQAVVYGVLRDTLSVYQSATFPFRRLRVILKCMEFLWKDGSAKCGREFWTVEHLGDEVVHLLAVEVTFLTLSPQYFNSFVSGPRV